MNRRGHRGRVDGNHIPIVETLRKAGALVQSLAQVGDGCPDVLVLYRGRLLLLEIKQSKGKLKPDQEKFIAAGWPVSIVRSPEEALAIVERALRA